MWGRGHYEARPLPVVLVGQARAGRSKPENHLTSDHPKISGILGENERSKKHTITKSYRTDRHTLARR